MELITVIVAIYNGERYLRECLDSIVEQDYLELEIILVDDGSPDKCGEIADQYANNDNRIIVIHQANLGASEARNNALNKSKGAYICIIDQDDIISRDYISYLYGLCIDYDAEISLTPHVDKFRKRPRRGESGDSIRVLSGEDTSSMMLYHNIVISPWNKMFKKSLIQSNGIVFKKDLFNGEGFAFSIECYLHSKRIAMGDRIIYHYRLGNPETGASVFREKYIKSSLEAQQYIKEVIHDGSAELHYAWKYSNWHTYCDCLNVMIGCEAEYYYPELYRILWEEAKKNAVLAIKAPVPLEQKIRGILFMINPRVASKIINRFRIRKFSRYVPG